MKKLIALLLFLISMNFSSANAAVYSINVGSETALDSDGYHWNPYIGPEYDETLYGSSFKYSMGTLDNTMAIHKEDLFAGYATGEVNNSYLGFQIFGLGTVNVELIAYSDMAIPVLQTMTGVGSIGALESFGTTTLGGESYYYSKYSATTSNDFLFAFYDTNVNAVQLTVPEPATMILIGVGGMMAAVIRKRRPVIAS